MKRFLLFTMMLAVASVFTACEDTDAKLAQDLKGAWKGNTLINGEEYPMAYQFFESTDGKTGKFVEITCDSYTEELDDIEFELPCYVYVGGKYTIDEGWLSLKYYPETTIIEMDEDAMKDFAEAYLLTVQDNPDWENATPEDVIRLYSEIVNEDDQESWQDMYEKSNTSGADGFSNLTIKDGKMSYKTGDAGVVEYESAKEVFKKYPFED